MKSKKLEHLMKLVKCYWKETNIEKSSKILKNILVLANNFQTLLLVWKQNMIKTNQITPFYKHCDLKNALKQKQSEMGGSNGSIIRCSNHKILLAYWASTKFTVCLQKFSKINTNFKIQKCYGYSFSKVEFLTIVTSIPLVFL